MGRGSEGLGFYSWLEGRQAWAGKTIDREGVPDMNCSGVKGVGIYIGYALDIFIGVSMSYMCIRAQDGRVYLEEAIGGLYKGL